MCLAFLRLSNENLRDLSKIALTLSVFELERCFFLKINRSEFRQNLLGTIIRVLVRNLRAQSEIRNHEIDQRVSVHSEPSVPPPPTRASRF